MTTPEQGGCMFGLPLYLTMLKNSEEPAKDEPFPDSMYMMNNPQINLIERTLVFRLLWIDRTQLKPFIAGTTDLNDYLVHSYCTEVLQIRSLLLHIGANHAVQTTEYIHYKAEKILSERKTP